MPRFLDGITFITSSGEEAHINEAPATDEANLNTYGIIKTSRAKLQNSPTLSNGTEADRWYSVGLNSSGQVVVNIPWTDTNTATAADNILKGSNNGTEITYAPYSSTTATATWVSNVNNAGKFYLGDEAPKKNKQLNYNGNFRATKLISDEIQLFTVYAPSSSGSSYSHTKGSAGQVLKSNGSRIYWGADANYYPTGFTWTNGTTSGPTGSLTGTGMDAVPFGAIPAAGASQSGVVTTGAQTFAGTKTFNAALVSNNGFISNSNTMVPTANGFKLTTSSNTTLYGVTSPTRAYKIVPVSSLPSSPDSNTIYLIVG